MVLDNIKMKETQGPHTCPPDMKQPESGLLQSTQCTSTWGGCGCITSLRALFSGSAVSLGSRGCEEWAAHILLPDFHVLLGIIWVELTSHSFLALA